VSDNDDQAQEIDPKIRIGTDVFGDPIITVDLVTPPAHAMAPETAELIALKLMAAAAAARARAGLMRGMLLDGASEVEARRAIDKYMP
jgi:hypothetical protein